MLTHGYRLVANANTAAHDFFPSLIGLDPSINPKADRLTPAGTDTYFEQTELPAHEITSLSMTRWVNFENVDDPILGVKSSRGSFYIPFSEFRDTAIEQQSLEMLELLRALPTLPRGLRETLQ